MEDLQGQFESIRQSFAAISHFVSSIPSYIAHAGELIIRYGTAIILAWGFAFVQRFFMVVIGIWRPR